MPDDPLEGIDRQGLSRLWALHAAAAESWQPHELAEMFAHQLAAPLEDALREKEPPLQGVPRDTTASPPRLHSFGDLLAAGRPPLKLLDATRQFARDSDEARGGDLPAPVASVLYLAAIAAALVRCGEKISRTPAPQLAQHLARHENVPWVPADIRALFRQARQVLDQHSEPS